MNSQFTNWAKNIQHWLKLLRFIAPAILISVILLSSVSAGEIGAFSNLIVQDGDEPLPRTDYHRETGMLSFLGANPRNPLKIEPLPGRGILPKDRALVAASQFGNAFGLKNASTELRLMREEIVGGDRSSLRYQQIFQGIPVIAGEMVINMDARGDLLSINGELSPDLSVSTVPQISAAAARSEAIAAVSTWYDLETSELRSTKPELWIYDERLLRPSTRPVQLVWRVEVTARARLEIKELVLVDANSGGIPLHFNQIHTVKQWETYDAENGTTLPGTLRCDQTNPTCSGGDIHEMAAHTYTSDTYNFYMTYHGRDSFDGAGETIMVTVHYSTSSFTALWNGTQVVLGDLYGFPLGDDLIGHEITHGVTDNESNLFYYYESGAINESLSDIWGEFIDQTNGAGSDTHGVKWLMGEDVSGWFEATGDVAFRDMAHPPNYDHPDRMTSSLYFETTGDLSDLSLSDNGGVHINSGVNNKAAYLMTDGDTFNGKTITGLGITKVAAIYYEVQTNYLTSGSGFADLYNYLFQGCLNLIGGSTGITAADCEEVREAADAVEMDQEPTTNFNPDAATCPAGESPTNLFFDNLEAGASNWSFTDKDGDFPPSSWMWDFGYSASGTRMLWGNDSISSSDTVAAMNLNVTLPGGSAPFLHFKHAFGFENMNFNDGGWLEYSTNGGGSWADAGGFFNQGMDYMGSLAGSNPNSGQSAFVADSHGYVSSRYDLSSLAGQNVRFRWRLSTGPTGSDIGWVVDDVRIYTCGTVGDELVFLPIVMNGIPSNQIGSGVPNGDFESGATVWVESSTNGFDLILNPSSVPDPFPVTPHGGNWAVWLGGANNETSTITQLLTVPISSPYLAYWHWISSIETTCGEDVGSVLVNTDIVENYNLCDDENTTRWVKRVVDLSAYAGDLISLQFKAVTNNSIDVEWSSVYIDDVAFQAIPMSFAESQILSDPLFENSGPSPQKRVGEP